MPRKALIQGRFILCLLRYQKYDRSARGVEPKSLHRSTNPAQPLDPTEKEKTAAEPMGATNIISFPVKPICCTLFRVSMQGFG